MRNVGRGPLISGQSFTRGSAILENNTFHTLTIEKKKRLESSINVGNFTPHIELKKH